MQQSSETEILDRGGVPEDQVERAYRDLVGIHRFLGDTRAIISAARRSPVRVRRILDIGCASGGVLRHIQTRLGIEAIGVDLNPPARSDVPFPIVRADAIRDPLPAADLAFSMYMVHHLPPSDIAALIRNVGQSCRRLILLDLVRHPLPLALFRLFVAPLVSPIVVADGCVSIRRSYTPDELSRIARDAAAGIDARVRHSIAPLYVRQVLDIEYAVR
ncbi:MAG TPA: methyltransferase domain-containing protein [Bryobacteraceae bacterium]